ncbi:iron chaperone [Fundicoccus culcitae]|uniref:DUF1801 domain-containing protein n=1 Tax=Fundicoccus culcitae TaxID=2969821 RepID=A0ABY5P648_9LACT|nr:DUF1801 domain-containing protein [Fundicoccus culcitae]UUX33855.1 DUF1801 domain-containing protein [Fundicoccus culcitae]
MTSYQDILNKISEPTQKEHFQNLVDWVQTQHPDFDQSIKWSQLLFEYNGTFIVGFKPTKNFVSVTSEKGLMAKFADKVEAAGYTATDMTYKVPWTAPFNFDLLEELIQIQLEDKKDLNKYWR